MQKGSVGRQSIFLSARLQIDMDRNNRYPRRGGCMSDCRYNNRVSPDFYPEKKQGNYRDNCLCTDQPISLAMAYVKDQTLGEIYSPSDALKNGTLFPELNKPYCMGGKRR